MGNDQSRTSSNVKYTKLSTEKEGNISAAMGNNKSQTSSNVKYTKLKSEEENKNTVFSSGNYNTKYVQSNTRSGFDYKKFGDKGRDEVG